MLEFYEEKISFYYNDNFIGNCDLNTYLTESKPQNKTIPINWNNIEEVLQYKEITNKPFLYYSFKKNKRIEFYDRIKAVSENKSPKLNMLIKYTYTIKYPTLYYILNWHNAKDASKYLKEHNLLNWT